jgi:2-keto-4-pentenoate hydratase/2-oxohepta-3-ene-1,7-dioic acid hydratase in catechol pathway
MKIVRFQRGQHAGYGVWENEVVREIVGSIYGDFRISSTTHRIGDVRLLAPAEPTKILCVGLNFRNHI